MIIRLKVILNKYKTFLREQNFVTYGHIAMHVNKLKWLNAQYINATDTY